ncbi:MAG TPA: glycosyltransferase [Acidisphaera sp.]|nr:glycosyltransferase [Acidisphaera sp.]
MTIATVALILAAFPLALALLNLLVYRTPPAARDCPKVSILIPARNEEANIGDAVACALASEGVEVEVVVLDDHSTDGTAAVLASIQDAKLRVAEAPPLPPGWSGKQHACATLATLAQHELMVFVDADVRLAPEAVARMAGAMQRRPSLGLASGFPRQVFGGWAERLLLPMIHVLLLGYLPMLAARVFRVTSFGAGCGQLFVARRDAYVRAGGHGAIRASLHDGITLPRAFRRAGIMTGLFDASAFASCRMYQDTAQVWEGLTKNATEGMATPVALPVWTALLAGGHLLPWLLLLSDPSRMAVAAVLCSLGLRALVALRFDQPLRDVPLQPLSVLSVLVVQWAALIRALRGRPATWRGRAYPAQ